MEAIVKVKHFARTVTKSSKGLAVSEVVVGTQAGKMMRARMQFVLPCVVKLALATWFFKPLEQTSLGEILENGT